MSRSDRVKSIIRHIKMQYADYSVTECVFHVNKSCLTLLNNFNTERFHCLFANQALIWRSCSLTKSCDLPDHFHDMLLLNLQLGDDYVLPFAGQFRESSGYTVAMFRQNAELYSPIVVDRGSFKKLTFAMIVLFVAVGYRLGGITPEIRHFSFAYADDHPVLCDIGSSNGEKKELINGKERFDRKKWSKFLRRKKILSVVRYLKIYFPNYFQKKKAGCRCILNDGERGVGFDDETHVLVCGNAYLIEVLQDFKHLMPDPNIRDVCIPRWISLASNDSGSDPLP